MSCEKERTSCGNSTELKSKLNRSSYGEKHKVSPRGDLEGV